MAGIVKPRRVGAGSKIAVIAPAGPPKPDRLQKGMAYFQKLGYEFKVYSQVKKRTGYLAGDDKSRAAAINDAFADTTIDGIFASRGGYGCLRLLPYIDFNIIKANPKVLVGYSDLTVLLIAIYAKCKLVTFHGPMLSIEFGKPLKKYTAEYFHKALEFTEPIGSIAIPADYRLQKIAGGSVSGPIIGGNLSLIARMSGTGFLPSFRDKIVFIEDTEEEPYRIDAYLSQLFKATDLLSARGFVIGEMTKTEPRYGRKKSWTAFEVIKDYFTGLNKPVIYNFPCGHGKEKITIPVGVEATLDADKKDIRDKRGWCNMKINYREHEIHLVNTFRTSHGASDAKKVIITDIDGGLGEASPVNYYGENFDTVKAFLERAKGELNDFDPMQLETLGQKLNSIAAWNYSVKASIDIAIHDLIGKKLGIPLYQYFGITPRTDLATSFTISISNPDTMKKQTEQSPGYLVYKVKVGAPGDIEMVAAVRDATKARIRVDANEGWGLKDAIWRIKELEKLDVEFIEQPLHRDDFDGFRILRSKVDMPIIADEGVFTAGDIPKYVGLVDGINIKLSKSGGMREAFKMIAVARAHRMKIMIGCMIETSVGITAAAHLASLVDYADLDGNVLISDDPYRGVRIVDGCLNLPNKPGLGIEVA